MGVHYIHPYCLKPCRLPTRNAIARIVDNTLSSTIPAAVEEEVSAPLELTPSPEPITPNVALAVGAAFDLNCRSSICEL